MLRGNTILLRLKKGIVAQTGNLFQYDYGQRLILEGIELPNTYEVHFSNSDTGNSKTSLGDATGVDIPDEYLLTGDKIHVWLFVHTGEDDGETEYHGIINVKKRARPTNATPTPVQQDVITQTIAALNEAVAGVEDSIDEALAEAKASGEFDGEDGYSPTVAVSEITGGHTVTITDESGDHAFNVMDGEDTDPTTLIDDTSTTATNKVWSAKKSADENSALSGAIALCYTKPSGGIPSTDLADSYIEEPSSEGTSGQFLQTDGNGGRTWATPSGGGGGGVSDVQVNGTSVVTQGVANVPVASANDIGAVAIGNGLTMSSNKLNVQFGSSAVIKAGTANYQVAGTAKQHELVYYGLSKLAGEDLKNDTVTVGTYPEKSKSAIHQMLDAPETVSGSTPSITAKPGVRYICGEVSTLTIVVPSTGIIDVTFDSGSTPTALTVTPPTGMTMRWIGADPTALEANKHYEVNIMDGCNGMVVSWT